MEFSRKSWLCAYTSVLQSFMIWCFVLNVCFQIREHCCFQHRNQVESPWYLVYKPDTEWQTMYLECNLSSFKATTPPFWREYFLQWSGTSCDTLMSVSSLNAIIYVTCSVYSDFVCMCFRYWWYWEVNNWGNYNTQIILYNYYYYYNNHNCDYITNNYNNSTNIKYKTKTIWLQDPHLKHHRVRQQHIQHLLLQQKTVMMMKVHLQKTLSPWKLHSQLIIQMASHSS